MYLLSSFYSSGQRDESLFVFAFGDAFGDADGAGGAHEAAQVATDALAAHEVGLAVVAEGDGLVAAVHTGDVASAATNTILMIKYGIYNGVTVQVAGLDKVGQLFTNER